MSRAPGWIHPRRRHRRKLGLCEITYHALDSYRNRVAPKARAADLERVARDAYLIGCTPTGERIYRAVGCRLIVHKPARRTPVVLTVIPGEGRA